MKKELYTIIDGGEEGLFKVRLNAEHAIFGGHFPDYPILPGICSMMIVRECASRMVGSCLEYSIIKDSKFLSAIVPGVELDVRVKVAQEEELYVVDATICVDEKVMLKLKATLTASE